MFRGPCLRKSERKAVLLVIFARVLLSTELPSCCLPLLLGTGGPPPAGSWHCKACGNVNYPHRTHCNKRNCGVKREDAEQSNGARAQEAAS